MQLTGRCLQCDRCGFAAPVYSCDHAHIFNKILTPPGDMANWSTIAGHL